MAVVMCQTRKVQTTVAPGDVAMTGTRARLTSGSRHFPRPDGQSLRLVGSRCCVGRADAAWLRTRDREPPE